MISKIFQYRTRYKTQDELFSAVSKMLVEQGYVTDGFEHAIKDREASYPTCLPLDEPVAIPHTDGEFVLHDAIVCILNETRIPFHALGGGEDDVLYPRLVLMLVMKEGQSHLMELQKLVENLQDDDVVMRAVRARDETEFEQSVAACV